MSYVLRKNLERFIKEQNYEVFELERKAGLKKNNIYNILKGLSKKPSAEILQSIADVLGISVKDLFSDSSNKINFLKDKDFNLIEKIVKNISQEVKALELTITSVDFVNVVKEVLDYSLLSDISEPDVNFIHWTLIQKCRRRE